MKLHSSLLTCSLHVSFLGRENLFVEEVKEAIAAGKEGWETMTEKHGGLVKPDIVFFGEVIMRQFFYFCTRLSNNSIPTVELWYGYHLPFLMLRCNTCAGPAKTFLRAHGGGLPKV